MIKPDTRRDQQEREAMFSIRPEFSAPTKIGNWNEELFLKEEKTTLGIQKRDKGQLLLQKVRKMFWNLSKPLQLSHCLLILEFGQNYQIVAPDIPCPVNKNKVRSVYLAGLVTEKEIEKKQEFSHGSAVVGSLHGSPCVRNTFRFVGCDRNRTGEPINYGDNFYIQIVDDSKAPLYIRCESNFSQLGYHLKPTLSEYTDSYCLFKMLHFTPVLRSEMEGTFVRANERLVIQNVSTGMNLAVEKTMVVTFFGNEYVITCYTFKDTHKMESAENIWMVVGEDLPNINAAFMAAKGEKVPDEMLK